jgi:hypothetical protein
MPPRLVSVLTVIQWLVVFLGVFITGGFLRMYGARWGNAPVPPFPQFVRDYGFWLITLPLCWALAATLSVRSPGAPPSIRPFYLIAGFILLAVLCIVFSASGFVAFQAATYTGLRAMEK